MPLIDTQTGAIEVGHTRPAFKPHIIIEACSLPVRGIVLGLYSVALVVGQASVLMRNRASQSAVPALSLPIPANWGHMD